MFVEYNQLISSIPGNRKQMINGNKEKKYIFQAYIWNTNQDTNKI